MKDNRQAAYSIGLGVAVYAFYLYDGSSSPVLPGFFVLVASWFMYGMGHDDGQSEAEVEAMRKAAERSTRDDGLAGGDHKIAR